MVDEKNTRVKKRARPSDPTSSSKPPPCAASAPYARARALEPHRPIAFHARRAPSHPRAPRRAAPALENAIIDDRAAAPPIVVVVALLANPPATRARNDARDDDDDDDVDVVRADAPRATTTSAATARIEQ